MNIREIRQGLASARPSVKRQLGYKLLVEPRSNRYGLVGTAFDYLLRFEIQRLAPHASIKRWTAEAAVEKIWCDDGSSSFGLDLFHGVEPDLYLPPEEVARRGKTIIESAKSDLADYVASESPAESITVDLAKHTIRLAHLDSFYRSTRLDRNFEVAHSEDADDLVAMLKVVPWGELVDDSLMYLNPDFGGSSMLVKGADADLISGETLIDIKSVKNARLEAKYLDQLFGYFILARHERSTDRKFPEIGKMGLYFSRYGRVWKADTELWTSFPEFKETEQWFLEEARKRYGK